MSTLMTVLWVVLEEQILSLKTLIRDRWQQDGSHIFGSSILKVELRTIWTDITYMRLIIRVDRLVIKDDSFTIISWIQSCTKKATIHPLL